ncbi:queuosine precursor transporter [Sorangium cellulosum]|uniref:Probable queuosine precursor transporter n=1 Tax=Sorangium cellulosum TaxID=56 RepID=A0A150QW99_SORCE|nr:queuosine precursor transporter [Sorangium cellulosum]KYF72260.1 transporter [Sorangium cellulosum]
MDSPRALRYLDLVTAAFVCVLVVSNVASSAKIVSLGFSLFGIPMAFDGGTLLFPVSYIFGDILTEVYGFRTSRRVIWTGFVALAASSLVFFVLKALPGDPSWEGYAGQAAYNAILGGMSSGGIVAASLAGFLMGGLSNALVLARLKVLTGGKALWMRTIGSTLVGQLVDTVAFVVVASAFGVFGWDLFVSLVVSNYLFKCLVEALMTPATYRAVQFLKGAEGIDVYDWDLRITLPRLRPGR